MEGFENVSDLLEKLNIAENSISNIEIPSLGGKWIILGCLNEKVMNELLKDKTRVIKHGTSLKEILHLKYLSREFELELREQFKIVKIPKSMFKLNLSSNSLPL